MHGKTTGEREQMIGYRGGTVSPKVLRTEVPSHKCVTEKNGVPSDELAIAVQLMNFDESLTPPRVFPRRNLRLPPVVDSHTHCCNLGLTTLTTQTIWEKKLDATLSGKLDGSRREVVDGYAFACAHSTLLRMLPGK